MDEAAELKKGLDSDKVMLQMKDGEPIKWRTYRKQRIEAGSLVAELRQVGNGW